MIRIALCLRCKLREVVEPDLLLKLGHLGDGLLETVLAEMLMFALLHLFADGIELMAGDDVAELRKQYGASRAACGRYIVMNSCMALTQLRFAAASLRTCAVDASILRVTSRPA